MSGILSIKEVAAKYKMVYIGSCHCSGYDTEKYSDGVYTLSWRKNKYSFKLRKKNATIKDWTPVKELQKFMEDHFKKPEHA